MAADVEETEAMAIQKRLLAEIDTTDDVFEFLVQKPKQEAGEKQLSQQVINQKPLSLVKVSPPSFEFLFREDS